MDNIYLADINGAGRPGFFDDRKKWRLGRSLVRKSKDSTMRLITLAVALFITNAFAEEKLQLKHGERILLNYNTAVIPSPIGNKPYYQRSGFIHPVYTPAGKILTDPFPKDHLHQHGLMFAWTSAKYEGQKIDFWNSPKKQGHIEHIKTESATENKIIVKLAHIIDTKNEPTTILNEIWEVSTVAHPSLNIFDLKSTQTCATEIPVQIDKYHYGALCIRGSAEWTKKVKFLTSEGKTRIDGNHTHPNWVIMAGPLGDSEGGIAVMCHPKNFRAPQAIRINPKVPYFCFAPMITGEFSISPKNPYISRFRFITFDGPADVAKLSKIWLAYSKE